MKIDVTECDSFGGHNPKVGVNHVHLCLCSPYVSKCLYYSHVCFVVSMIDEWMNVLKRYAFGMIGSTSSTIHY